MKTDLDPIPDILGTFFRNGTEDLVEIMEAMLYEWYQHYALEHYQREHINEVVNGVFRVNDLLLKLNDAMQQIKKEQGRSADHFHEDHFNLLFAV